MQPLEWRLRLACAERGIWSAAELRRLVSRRTGIALSPQTVQECFRERPARLDVRTLTAILNALACPLGEIIRFTPPSSDAEARATPEETARYRRPGRRGDRLAPPPAAREDTPMGRPRSTRLAMSKRQGKTTRPQPHVERMLAALAEGAEPVAAEHLEREARPPSTPTRLEKKTRGKP